MIYLLLAILCSAMISICMRVSEKHIKDEIGMFMINYGICAVLTLVFMDYDGNLLGTENQIVTVITGICSGILYLGGFLMLKFNIKHNGIVLSATFMKLGVMLPTVLAVVIFRELPTLVQTIGIVMAIIAIVIIHFEKDSLSQGDKKVWLIVLLIVGGMTDSMSNFFDKLGHISGKNGYLLLTFCVAFALTVFLVIKRKKKITKYDVIYGVLVGVPNYYFSVFLLAALREVSAVIVYPTYSIGAMVLIVLAGVIAFNEKISKKKGIALCMIAVAIALLNI